MVRDKIRVGKIQHKLSTKKELEKISIAHGDLLLDSSRNQKQAKMFNKSDATISGIVGDNVKKRKMSRDSKIIKLSLLGWTQDMIGDEFGLDRSKVSKIVTNFSAEKSHIREQFFQKRKSIEKLIGLYDIDTITAWNIVLDEEHDLERFKIFSPSSDKKGNGHLKSNDSAICVERDQRLGIKHPGNIPGQFVMNMVHYFTDIGDMVVDPMAGGGSTMDACLVMGRECLSYDLSPTRYEIIQHDLSDGFPQTNKKISLIFLDPPY